MSPNVSDLLPKGTHWGALIRTLPATLFVCRIQGWHVRGRSAFADNDIDFAILGELIALATHHESTVAARGISPIAYPVIYGSTTRPPGAVHPTLWNGPKRYDVETRSFERLFDRCRGTLPYLVYVNEPPHPVSVPKTEPGIRSFGGTTGSAHTRTRTRARKSLKNLTPGGRVVDP